MNTKHAKRERYLARRKERRMTAASKSAAKGAGAAPTPDQRLKEAETRIEELLGDYADSSAYRSVCEEMVARAQAAIEALDEDEDNDDLDDADGEDTES